MFILKIFLISFIMFIMFSISFFFLQSKNLSSGLVSHKQLNLVWAFY